MLSAPDKPLAKYPHVYAVVRFDRWASRENSATVVKVIPSRHLAENEAGRLNEVNEGRDCINVVPTTGFVETPEAAGG